MRSQGLGFGWTLWRARNLEWRGESLTPPSKVSSLFLVSVAFHGEATMSLSSYSSHRKLSPLTLMGVTLFRDQDHWVTPNADFQTRNQVAKISTGHFKKPGRECRLWHASRFASVSRLTRCQEGELISSQDALPKHNKDLNYFQDSSEPSPLIEKRDTIAFAQCSNFSHRAVGIGR